MLRCYGASGESSVQDGFSDVRMMVQLEIWERVGVALYWSSFFFWSNACVASMTKGERERQRERVVYSGERDRDSFFFYFVLLWFSRKQNIFLFDLSPKIWKLGKKNTSVRMFSHIWHANLPNIIRGYKNHNNGKVWPTNGTRGIWQNLFS